MTFLLVISAVPVLYGAGAPMVAYSLSMGRMAMIQGAPGYPNEHNPYLDNIKMLESSTSKPGEIIMPEQGSSYGTIHCDRIGLSVRIYYGDDDSSLQSGAGHYSKSSLPGAGKPILISGHDITYFAPLEHIQDGDIVYILTDVGRFDYEVKGRLITDASDTAAYDLKSDEEQLILYTCYPFGKLIGDRESRIFIYCYPVIVE